MKNKKTNTIELILLIIMVSGILYSLIQNEILDNNLYLILVIIIPFTLVLMIEIIKITNKQEESKEQLKEEEKQSLTQVAEKTIEKIEKATPKKDKKQEETIQIPVEEIKKEIEILNEKLGKKNSNDLEKTEILFTKGELKEVIEKELETVKKEKKSTKTVEKSKNRNKKDTTKVEKIKKSAE